MKAIVKTADGDALLVENITCIKAFKPVGAELVREYKSFDAFAVHKILAYDFIGDQIVSIGGENIQYVFFKN